ncbi:MAG: penicillin-binding protein 2 [Spirochaetia bacterium]|nr:penicillin-binding protein 2 [Spirochaetia bacterium]
MSNNPFENQSIRKERLFFLVLVVCAVFAVFTGYLFSMQVTRWMEYQNRAWAVARRTSEVPALRGEIYDRNYDVPLASNVDSFAVSIVTAETDRQKLPQIISNLAAILGTDPQALMKKIPQADLFQAIELKDNVSYGQVVQIASNIEDFPGITWNSKPVRHYNHTPSLSHIIGYVGNINTEELHLLYNKGYEANSIIGKTGIEKEYDLTLKGTPGLKSITVDAKGRNVQEERYIKAPVPGKNIVLTIDRRIQELCEKALGQRMGSVVVLKPATGEILAMVSYPSYDTNRFYAPDSASYYSTLLENGNHPFLNRCIQSANAPASVFKTIMMTAILEEKAFPPNQTIDCTGKLVLGNRTFNCHLKTGHGSLNLSDALKESCDVYFWEVGSNYLGPKKIEQYSRMMGLGEKTGVDLPGEVAGLVPSPEWKLNRINEMWLGGDTYNMSIGQGYTQVTTLQIADLIAMIVNEGTIYTPHLLKEVRDVVTGEVVEEWRPRILHKADISSQTFRELKKAMRRVVAEGSIRRLFNNKVVPVAGKTGTGEVGYTDRWISWFASFGPYQAENPEDQVVVVVMVEASNEWEWWAPKASNAIYQGIFANQSYEEVVQTLDIWYLNNGTDVIRRRSE